MEASRYTIQELIEASGVARRNIYFYTQQGILPPPEGAGLAARYSEIHLLRLKAIPVLRSQGLRLDDIRQRLAAESLEGLRQLSANLVREEHPADPLPGTRPPHFAPGVRAQAVQQYHLPGGVVLYSPAVMSAPDRQLFQRLLDAARTIYSTPQMPHDGGKE